GKTSRRRTLIAPIRRLLKAADTSGLFFRVAPGWAPHGSDRPRDASRSVAGNDTTTRFPALPDFTTL
ncbi:TPA: hypothetical protein ACRMXW_004319, partial [Pseudomonas aeruginosa]